MRTYRFIYSDELYHHGIKGQKWGVWNDETRARRTGVSNHIGNNSSAKTKFKLSKGQKKALIIGASVAVACVAAYGSVKLLDNKISYKMASDTLKEDALRRATDIGRRMAESDKKMYADLESSKITNDAQYLFDAYERKKPSEKDISKLADEIRDYRKEKFVKPIERATNKYARMFPSTEPRDPLNQYGKSSYGKKKDLKDFTFERRQRVDADGNVSSIDVPTDKKGYADAFARNMSDNQKDYDYWYNYMTKKLDHM